GEPDRSQQGQPPRSKRLFSATTFPSITNCLVLHFGQARRSSVASISDFNEPRWQRQFPIAYSHATIISSLTGACGESPLRVGSVRSRVFLPARLGLARGGVRR